MNKDKEEDKIKINKWLFDQLDILKCAKSEVLILYTRNTKKEVSKIFPASTIPQNNRYQWDEFRGCENSVVICLFSSKDKAWQLLTMASRAQQHLIILNLIVSPRDTDLCAEIENVNHISFEDICSSGHIADCENHAEPNNKQ